MKKINFGSQFTVFLAGLDELADAVEAAQRITEIQDEQMELAGAMYSLACDRARKARDHRKAEVQLMADAAKVIVAAYFNEDHQLRDLAKGYVEAATDAAKKLPGRMGPCFTFRINNEWLRINDDGIAVVIGCSQDKHN